MWYAYRGVGKWSTIILFITSRRRLQSEMRVEKAESAQKRSRGWNGSGARAKNGVIFSLFIASKSTFPDVHPPRPIPYRSPSSSSFPEPAQRSPQWSRGLEKLDTRHRLHRRLEHYTHTRYSNLYIYIYNIILTHFCIHISRSH